MGLLLSLDSQYRADTFASTTANNNNNDNDNDNDNDDNNNDDEYRRSIRRVTTTASDEAYLGMSFRKRASLVMLSFLFLITMLVPSAVNAAGYVNLCPVSEEEVTLWIPSPFSGTYNYPFNTYNGTTSTTNANDMRKSTVRARKCPCSVDNVAHYCVVGSGDYCGVSRGNDGGARCFYLTSRVVFIRNAWPVVILWYGALLIFLVATENGRNARDYLLSCCLRQRNRTLADRIVRREVILRDQMRAAAATQQRRVMELARMRREEERRTLVLKTKRYRDKRTTPGTPDTDPNTPSPTRDVNLSPSYDDDDDRDNNVVCTICIAPIEDGDRIGSLPCDHLFHSECLKQWIKRRNVCPLCQEPDIASPHRDDGTRNNGGNNNNNGGGNDASATVVLEEIQLARRRLEEVAVAINNWRGLRAPAVERSATLRDESPPRWLRRSMRIRGRRSGSRQSYGRNRGDEEDPQPSP